MKKKREFFLYVFVIASDRAEAEQIARRDGSRKDMRFYEFDHTEEMIELQFCNVYRVKKLPSVKELIKQIQGVEIERVTRCGTVFE